MGFNNPVVFSFFELPLDVQVEILRTCDAGSLRSLTKTCTQARNLYCTHAQTIIKAVLETKPCQFQYIIRTVLALRQGLLCPDDNDVEGFLQQHLEPTSHAFQVSYPPLPTLKLLHEITTDVEFFAELFFEHSVTLAFQCVDDSLRPAPAQGCNMSYTERYRTERALWRLVLFLELFHPCSWPGTHLSFRKLYNRHPFHDRLTVWENDEIGTVKRYLQDLVEKTFPSDDYRYMSRKDIDKYWKKLRPSTFLPHLYGAKIFQRFSMTPSFFPGHEFATVPTKHWSDAGEANGPSERNNLFDRPEYCRASSVALEFWDAERINSLQDLSTAKGEEYAWGGCECSFLRNAFFFERSRIMNRHQSQETQIEKLRRFWEVGVASYGMKSYLKD